jgi:hypothetical protein
MPRTLDFDSDPALKLLSDALRAGPESPQWREAVDRFGGDGPLNGDERALLYRVREDLASGRSYREVRAGPGFTRKVLAAVEEEREGRRKAVPAVNLVFILSALVIVGLIGAVAYWVSRGGSGDTTARPPQDLAQLSFVDTALNLTFESAPPAGWQPFGQLPLTFSRGVRPGVAAEADGYIGGALMWDTPIAPDQPVSIEVTLRQLAGGGGDVIPQVFVTDTPTFSDDRATTPHELVWLLRDGQAGVVLPSGRVPGEGLTVKPSLPRLQVQITLNRTSAAIEAGGKKLWTGEHGLSESRPRYIGIRFLARGAEVKEPPVFHSIRVQKARP